MSLTRELVLMWLCSVNALHTGHLTPSFPALVIWFNCPTHPSQSVCRHSSVLGSLTVSWHTGHWSQFCNFSPKLAIAFCLIKVLHAINKKCLSYSVILLVLLCSLLLNLAQLPHTSLRVYGLYILLKAGQGLVFEKQFLQAITNECIFHYISLQVLKSTNSLYCDKKWLW